VALLERLPGSCEIVEEKTHEAEPGEGSRDDKVITGRASHLDGLFEVRG